jgi:uncharacterized lipoprotein YbaY
MVVVVVEVVAEGPDQPASGAPLNVEIRDVGLADAAAVTLARATGTVRHRQDVLGTVKVNVPALPRHAAVWVHIDVDRDGRVSTGDFITVQRFPVPAGTAPHVRVSVRRV